MAKAARKRSPRKPPVVEDLYFRTDSAYLCVILNRRTGFARVIDFRAGPLPAKRMYIQKIAHEEGIAKVITLVEKVEVSTWTRVGFVREGTVPGFYKRSDGHLCGCVIGPKSASVAPDDGAERLVERTVNSAKKLAVDIPDEIKGVITRPVDAQPALAARDSAWRRGKAVSSFDVFGRDAQRCFIETNFRKSKTNFISAEYQDCFGHSLIEVLRRPENKDELYAITGGLRALGQSLTERGIVAAFSFAPSDDVELSTAFVAAGYRKTGLLAKGILIGEERKEAILWTRKLANPAGEEVD